MPEGRDEFPFHLFALRAQWIRGASAAMAAAAEYTVNSTEPSSRRDMP
jgi:hypothetical protein